VTTPPAPTKRPRGKRWRRLASQVRSRHEPCCRCHQPIDYRLAWPDPGSFSVDHYPYPLSTHPWLAWEPQNLRAAHLVCNQAGAAKAPAPALGTPSESW